MSPTLRPPAPGLQLPAPSLAPQASRLKTPSLTAFEHGVIDLFVRLADMLGLPKSVGEIYGLLYASPQPLAFQDIIDRLEISKGSASQGLRLLRANGAIKVVYVPTDRRDHYIPETELRTLISGFLREKIQPQLESGALRLASLKELAYSRLLCTSNTTETKILRARVDKLQVWSKRGKTIIPLMTKLLG